MLRLHPSITPPQSSKNIIPTSEMIEEKLVFDNLRERDLAFQQGMFYLKIPQSLDLHPGVQLAQNFYKVLDCKMPNYTGYKHRSFEKSTFGYADRSDQVEQLQLELHLWNEFFPKEVCHLFYEMNRLSVQVLENMLEYSDLSREDIDIITSGALENNAGHVATINHYRAEKETLGLVSHKDSGYLALLYANAPGCEARMNNEWYPIDCKEGYFLLLVGHVLEILTENLKRPITAPEHRVRQLYLEESIEDRISLLTFVTPRYDAHIYQYDQSGSLKIYRDYMSFLKEDFRKINYAHPKVE